MPDIYVVNSAGFVISKHIDRSEAFREVYGIGEACVAHVYEGDCHDVISPARINPVARAAKARRDAYFASFSNCIECKLEEYQHGYYRCFDDYEKRNYAACDEYVRPMPLVIANA